MRIKGKCAIRVKLNQQADAIAHRGTMPESEFNDSPSARHPGHGVDCSIKRVGNDTFEVLSSGSRAPRTVKLLKNDWSCTCPYGKRRRYHCKHINVVEALVLLPHVDPARRTVLDPVPACTCPHCQSTDCKKAGVRRNGRYANQRYACRKCGRGFSANAGFGKLSAPPDVVSDAISMYCDGLSAAKVCESIKRRHGWRPSDQTVRNWVESRGDMADKLSGSLKPCLSEKSRTDGMMVEIDGEQYYLHSMLDDGTRYWYCYVITRHKATDDVSPMFREAERVGGKKPTLLVSDGDPTYHDAWKREWRQRNPLWKKTHHHRHIHASKDNNNNAMESFNNRVRSMLAPRRGIKSARSQLIKALRVHYNHVSPHEGLGGATPGEAAGIIVNGDKWRTLIQHAHLRGIKPGG